MSSCRFTLIPPSPVPNTRPHPHPTPAPFPGSTTWHICQSDCNTLSARWSCSCREFSGFCQHTAANMLFHEACSSCGINWADKHGFWCSDLLWLQDYRVHIKHTDGHFEHVPYFSLPANDLTDVIAPSCYSCFDYPNALADLVTPTQLLCLLFCILPHLTHIVFKYICQLANSNKARFFCVCSHFKRLTLSVSLCAWHLPYACRNIKH